jgi:ribosomal protein L2
MKAVSPNPPLAQTMYWFTMSAPSVTFVSMDTVDCDHGGGEGGEGFKVIMISTKLFWN